MYKKILVPTDGSPLSKKAMKSAVELASTLGAEMVAVNVVPRYPTSYFEGGITVTASEVARVEKQWAEHGQALAERGSARPRREGGGEGALDHRALRPRGRGDPRRREEEQMRPHRDGLPRPPGPQAPAARKRDAARADPWQYPGAGPALTGTPSTNEKETPADEDPPRRRRQQLHEEGPGLPRHPRSPGGRRRPRRRGQRAAGGAAPREEHGRRDRRQRVPRGRSAEGAAPPSRNSCSGTTSRTRRAGPSACPARRSSRPPRRTRPT